ncbi:hypothetical protein BDR07DRAFT_1403379, partial [Suillus spraguei]
MIALNPTGTLLASASEDHQVRIWRLSDHQTIAIFTCTDLVYSHSSGGRDKMISKWAVPSSEYILKDQPSGHVLPGDTPKEQAADNLLTKEINDDSNDYNSYANRSFVMARKADWDHALMTHSSIQPSLMGCISKGIALCGKRQFQNAMKAFDLGFLFVDANLKKTHLLLLIKAIALFNAHEHEEAILRVQDLATTCPSVDILACQIVEVNSVDGVHYNEAADHFTSAVNTIRFSSMSAIHSKYDVFVVLFGWDLMSLWRTAHQNQLQEAFKAYRYMMDTADEATQARCLIGPQASLGRQNFQRDCSMHFTAGGDDALAAGNYDRAIELYSAVINLDLATDTIFANRSKARSGKMLWDDALIDAKKVIELNPSSYIGYQLKHAVLHGAHRYDEAIEASNSCSSNLRQQYINPSEAEVAIQETIKAQLNDVPHRLLDTFTGRLCDREVQISAFRKSTEYKELLSSLLVHIDLRKERIKDVVATYFRCVTLSHRWEGKEPLLHDIKDKVVDELEAVGGITKLQSFCKTARAAGYRWGWIDSCCIDQANNVELQKSLNSMFTWYRTSALTMVYLSDVPPSSKPGALARSAWNTRGWTVPEFLAPKVIRFYQSDWTPYLDDHSPNHKKSAAIMQELGDATGIDAQTLVAFSPGMINAREKLQWASTRFTTVEEDIAYSLFGIFGVQLPIMYGEKKQRALGRLLQEIVAESGDITALDWVGTSSEFNSCLPAHITSYKTSLYTLPPISEDEMQRSVSSLQDTVVVELALKLYSSLERLRAPRFDHRRLHLPCIVFPVTEIRRRSTEHKESYFTYAVKADGLRDLQISTEDKLSQFTRGKPARRPFLLVRPWDRRLFELPDHGDDTES